MLFFHQTYAVLTKIKRKKQLIGQFECHTHMKMLNKNLHKHSQTPSNIQVIKDECGQLVNRITFLRRRRNEKIAF